MHKREALQVKLEQILGTNNVYFQPPESVKMHYPAIVYERDDIYSRSADNKNYTNVIKYVVTLIDKDPNSSIIYKILKLPMCSFSRHFTNNNLNHDVFELYY